MSVMDPRDRSAAAAVELMRKTGFCARLQYGTEPDERHLCQRRAGHLEHCKCWCGHRWRHLTLEKKV